MENFFWLFTSQHCFEFSVLFVLFPPPITPLASDGEEWAWEILLPPNGPPNGTLTDP